MEAGTEKGFHRRREGNGIIFSEKDENSDIKQKREITTPILKGRA